MGLMQKAIETYESNSKYVGQARDGYNPIAPVSHKVVSAHIELVLDMEGKLVYVRELDEKAEESKTIIPVTIESANRTSGGSPHPLSDGLVYLAPASYMEKSRDKTKHPEYKALLRQWADYSKNKKLEAVYKYIDGATLVEDLKKAGIVETEVKSGAEFLVDKYKKYMVRWSVTDGIIDDKNPDECWKNKSLMNSYIEFYQSLRQSKIEDKTLCMLTGDYQDAVDLHMGIIGNKKLISANDETNFTYRGRFTDKSQAITISYDASQKAHNALRWVISEFGERVGGESSRVFVCWNPKCKNVPTALGRIPGMNNLVTKPENYRTELKRVLAGYQSELPEKEGVVIAVFDAATTGRLALTYYNELQSSDYLQRLYKWDTTCCWPNGPFGVQSPGLRSIVNCAFGIERGDKASAKENSLVTDYKIMQEQLQRLLSCRIDGMHMPFDIVRALYERFSSPLCYSSNTRNKLAFVACAVIRKYRMDRFKEEWEMVLDPHKKDRSYQFGRLLAVFEKIEKDTYGQNDDRETYAIRNQSIYSRRPMATAKRIEEQLVRAYLRKLKPGNRVFYDKLVNEIYNEISQFPDNELNKSLSETYILGYHLQKNALYTKAEKLEGGESNE
jgi:CRISPR-associated protein Csd1